MSKSPDRPRGGARVRRKKSAPPGNGPRLIGMVHLAPLPGSPLARTGLDAVIEQATQEARILTDAGFDAVMVENFGDHPFYPDRVPPETIAAMAIVVESVVRAVTCPVGVNVLRNDARAALAIAAVTGASFIRVNVHSGVAATDQGILTGEAAWTVRERERLAASVGIFADVHVKHAVPLSQPDLAQAARDTAYRGLADGVIVSGSGTGQPTSLEDVRTVKQAVPDRPVWVGSGVTAESAATLLTAADGLIVGTCLKQSGVTEGPLAPARAREFVRAAKR